MNDKCFVSYIRQKTYFITLHKSISISVKLEMSLNEHSEVAFEEGGIDVDSSPQNIDILELICNHRTEKVAFLLKLQ